MARDTGAALVEALGGKAEADAIAAVVAQRMKADPCARLPSCSPFSPPSPALAAGDKPFFSLAKYRFRGHAGLHRIRGHSPLLQGTGDGRPDAGCPRRTGIRKDLADARALRDEAQALLASYEKKQREVSRRPNRTDRVPGRDEASRAAAAAKDDIRASVARRLAAATERIAAAEKAAVKEGCGIVRSLSLWVPHKKFWPPDDRPARQCPDRRSDRHGGCQAALSLTGAIVPSPGSLQRCPGFAFLRLEGRHAGPGQRIRPLVFRVARMALDPVPAHIVAGCGCL